MDENNYKNNIYNKVEHIYIVKIILTCLLSIVIEKKN